MLMEELKSHKIDIKDIEEVEREENPSLDKKLKIIRNCIEEKLKKEEIEHELKTEDDAVRIKISVNGTDYNMHVDTNEVKLIVDWKLRIAMRLNQNVIRIKNEIEDEITTKLRKEGLLKTHDRWEDDHIIDWEFFERRTKLNKRNLTLIRTMNQLTQFYQCQEEVNRFKLDSYTYEIRIIHGC